MSFSNDASHPGQDYPDTPTRPDIQNEADASISSPITELDDADFVDYYYAEPSDSRAKNDTMQFWKSPSIKQRASFEQFMRGFLLREDGENIRASSSRIHRLIHVLQESNVSQRLAGNNEWREFVESFSNQDKTVEAYHKSLQKELKTLADKPGFQRQSSGHTINAENIARALDGGLESIESSAPHWSRLFKTVVRNPRSIHRSYNAMRHKQGYTQDRRLRGLIYMILAMMVWEVSKIKGSLLPKTLGSLLLSTGTHRGTIDVLNGLGICDCYASINKEVTAASSLAKEHLSQEATADNATL
ncbi:hypothetical protein F4804DRAFT_331376 [Jackrogersella minutella]|nr:hypothetical protein F4804DRAFT_331376 [Jackrogersella minutella]